MKKLRIALALAVTASMLLIQPGARASGSCAGADPRGDWPMYGHDLSNTRSQPLETGISPATVGSLAPKWVLPLEAAGFSGDFNITPAVADGCVYVATSDAWVIALNADTGELVWSTQVPHGEIGYSGSMFVGSPVVAHGKVFLNGNENGDPATGLGPSVIALDQATGDIVWKRVLDTFPYAFQNASPVVFNGMVMTGLNGPESDQRARGGFALLDADDGALIYRGYTISDDDYASGYAGGSIWSTPAIDTEKLYAYAGTGNPASKRVEHENTNAIVKIDVDPNRATFGKILAAYKGNSDSYYKAIGDQPVCEEFGDEPGLQISGVWSAPCVQLDLDFGASPNLFHAANGELRVGELQKSGVYHVVAASGLEKRFDLPAGPPCFACNASSSAMLGDQAFVAASPPGQMVSIDGSETACVDTQCVDVRNYNWIAPIGNPLHFQPVSAANGVVYTLAGGSLLAWDAATGMELLRRAMADDAAGAEVNGSVATSSAGIAIARGKLYAPNGGALVVYGL